MTTIPKESDQADQRRGQLIDIAAKLINEGGIDAAPYAKIAKIAGCTRSLVYHYFPKIQDLHVAIADSFTAKFSDLITVTEQKQAVFDSYQGPNEHTTALFSAVFDLFEANGIAPLILRYNAQLNPNFTPSLRVTLEAEELFQSIVEDRFSVSKLESSLFIEHCLSIIKTCFLYYRQEQMTRAQAIAEIESNIGYLLKKFS